MYHNSANDNYYHQKEKWSKVSLLKNVLAQMFLGIKTFNK